jgi:ketosteroid isomerase-like protein
LATVPLALPDRFRAVESAFAAIAEGDVDGMLAHYTDDVVFDMPYASPPVLIEGKAVVRKRLAAAFSRLRFSLEITDVYELADPDGLILEYTSSGHVLSIGDEYANRYIGVYRFRAGLISGVREFYNPLALR